jgi:hypothetical protein
MGMCRLLSSIDLIREEQMQRGTFFGAPAGLIPVEVPVYDELARVPWTRVRGGKLQPRPRLDAAPGADCQEHLCLAGPAQPGVPAQITRLDQIPDEELEKLARWGFTGLWLIGLWERSRASARIKQLMGNPEAIASAYSLYDYRIADDLGGEEAYRGLRDKAWRYGIRLASDMVPNHMGIDSLGGDHPDWFISLDYSPFPSYSASTARPFAGWAGQHSCWKTIIYPHDAAVVFKLLTTARAIAISITAMTARPCRGTIPPSSTT